MLDLDAIRALLDIHMGRGASKAALHAHILAYEHLVPALLSGLAAAQAARDALRERAEHAEAILTGLLPGPVSDALVDAHNHESRTEGVSAAADWGRTVGRVQVLAAAQAAPVVEWPAPLSWTLVHRDGRRVWITMRGAFTFDVLDVPDPEYAVGWFMAVNDAHPSDEGWGGPETGPAGKAACEAAYRRACGLPAIPPCAG